MWWMETPPGSPALRALPLSFTFSSWWRSGEHNADHINHIISLKLSLWALLVKKKHVNCLTCTSPLVQSGSDDRCIIHICSFYHECSTFLPVFDAKVDTYDALHRRSPFCVNAICMVAAKVVNGGGESPQRLPLAQFQYTHSTIYILHTLTGAIRSRERDVQADFGRSAEGCYGYHVFASDETGGDPSDGHHCRVVN